MKAKVGSLKKVVLIVAVVAGLLVVANILGMGTIRHSIRIAYLEHSGWSSWSASYAMLDGEQKHVLHPSDGQTVLHAEVVTEKGSVAIKIEDASGNVIFEKDDVPTSTFDVTIDGKSSVCINADNHKGSFRFEVVDK